jgi:hypothetical protein
MQQGYTHPLQGLLRRRLFPERKEYIVNAHVLRRCCPETYDSLRCDGPFDAARGRDASTTTEHTHRAYRTPVHTSFTRLVSRNGAGVRGCCKQALGVVASMSASAYSQGTSLPSSGFDVRRGAGLLQGRASNGPTKGAAIVLARRPSSGGAPFLSGEASFWGPLVEEKSNWRVHRNS